MSAEDIVTGHYRRHSDAINMCMSLEISLCCPSMQQLERSGSCEEKDGERGQEQ